MINIEPIQIATKGTATKIEILVMPFALSPTRELRMSYQLCDEKNKSLLHGNVEIPLSVYNDWGTDDSYIVNYVLNELSLQRS